MSKDYVLKKATVEDIEEMYNRSEFTWEGMNIDKDNLYVISGVIEQNGLLPEKPYTFWTWSGKMFNEMYNLTGDNRYPDDLTFLAIDNLYDPMFKIATGARWLDDIVDNNSAREQVLSEGE